MQQSINHEGKKNLTVSKLIKKSESERRNEKLSKMTFLGKQKTMASSMALNDSQSIPRKVELGKFTLKTNKSHKRLFADKRNNLISREANSMKCGDKKLVPFLL